MNPLSIAIIHPAFERLKNSGGWLHLLAVIIITANALTPYPQQNSSGIYFWCQIIVAADIFILVLAGKIFTEELRSLNLIFRLLEAIVFTMAGLILLQGNELTTGILQWLLATGYFYLYYCEKKLSSNEILSFFNLGIFVPNLPNGKMIYWIHIDRVDTEEDCISIITSNGKTLRYPLQKHLQAREVGEIHEFCRHYIS